MPVFNNQLAGAAGSGGAGDFKIEHSVRFNSASSSYLSRTPSSAGNRKTWTWSGWIKKTINNDSTSSSGRYFIFNADGSSQNSTIEYKSNAISVFDYNNGAYQWQLVTSAVLIDNSSWFHLVVVVDTTQATASNRVKIYINGVQQTSFSTSNYPSQNYQSKFNAALEHRIGALNNNSFFLDSYLADIHFIDGQALAATDFGEFDDTTEVWNPIEYSGTYGTNGFHLDFSNSSTAAALGYDAAGSNNWTVHNIGASVVDYTNSLTSQSLDTSVRSGSVSNIFNGDTTDKYEWNVSGTSSGSSGTFTITFNPALNVTSGLRVHAWLNDNQYDKHGISVNGGSYYYPNIYDGSNQWHDLLDTSYSNNTGFTGGTLNTLSFKTVVDMNGQNPSGWVRAIEVNGVQLTDSSIDVFRDSPSSYDDGTNVGGNFAVMNPLTKRAEVFLSNGNLDCSVTSGLNSWDGRKAFSTIGVTSGKWYAEMTVNTAGSVYAAICGNTESIDETASIGWQSQGWGYYKGGIIVIQSTEISSGIPSYGNGDIIGVALDVDNLKVKWYKNGTQVGTAAGYDITAGLRWFFAFDSYDASNVSWNFGQQPFAISTVPTGHKALCTQNFDDPLIDNSSTAFDIKLWTGDGTTSRAITGLDFSPDLLWIKSRSIGGWHALADNVRGAGRILASNAASAEYNNAGSQAAIQSFDSDGFTIGHHTSWSVNTSGASIAGWVWDGGDLATTSSSSYNQTRTWSDNAVGGRADEPIEDLFDGNVSTFAQNTSGNTNPNNLIVNFSPGLAYSSSVEVYPYNASSVAINNGSQTSTTNQQWNTVVSGSGTLTKLDFQRNHTNGCAVSAIRVDGKILINPGVVPVGSLNSSTYTQGDVYSDDLTTSGSASGSVTNAFDGNLTTQYSTTTGGAYTNPITFTPSGGLSYTSSVKVYSPSGQMAARINGGSWVSYTTDAVIATGSGTITTIEVTERRSSAGFGLYAIEVDGKILVDSNITPPNVPSIASTCRTNQTAGCSIVSYTGSGSNASISHNLNTKPSLIIVKGRTNVDGWAVQHASLGTNRLRLNTTDTSGNVSGYWNETAPTSSVFHVGGDGATNGNGTNYIAYCFAPVEGYSAFGYFLSGSDPFVYLGFSPRWVLLKRSDALAHWYMFDSERGPINPNETWVEANEDGAEQTHANGRINFLSNGFQAIGSDIDPGGGTVVYAAFGDPFKYSRAR